VACWAFDELPERLAALACAALALAAAGAAQAQRVVEVPQARPT
jgi:hypothetical protein